MLTEPIEAVTTSEPRQPEKKVGRVATVIVLCFITLTAGLYAAFPEQFKHQVELSFIRQPTPYTELFFSDPVALPAKLRIDKPNSFTFTIVNDEGRSDSFNYSVVVSTGKSVNVSRRGSVTIRNSGSASRTVAVVPKSRKSRYLITVVLGVSGQSIHFFGETS
jgi:hypothetical protein